jgi:hypothetical protein
MEPWCSDCTGSNWRCLEPSSSTSRSPPINLPHTSRKIGTHPTIKWYQILGFMWGILVCLLVCFLFSYRDPPKKPKKIHIFRCPITLRAAIFFQLICWVCVHHGWVLLLVRFVFSVLVFCSVLYLCRSPIPPSQITNWSTTLIGLPLLAALRELSLRQP